MRRPNQPPTVLTEDEEPRALPYVWEICDACRGEGKSSAYLGAFTQREWAEEDEDFKSDYLAGRYDRPCEYCHGTGKVMVLDEERCPPDLLKMYIQQQEDLAYVDRIAEAERRAGA